MKKDNGNRWDSSGGMESLGKGKIEKVWDVKQRIIRTGYIVKGVEK